MILHLILALLLAAAPVDTVSATAFPSPSASSTISPSRSPSASVCASATISPSRSPSASACASSSRSPSGSALATPTPTPTISPSQTRSTTRSPSTTACSSRSRSASQCVSVTRSPSASGAASASQPTLTPSPSLASLTASPCASTSSSPTFSPSPSPCGSSSSSPTYSPSPSPCGSTSGSPTRSRSATPCGSGTVSLTRSRSSTHSTSGSLSLSPSPSASPSISVSACPSVTISVTRTVSGSATATTTAAARPVWPGFHAGSSRAGATDISSVPINVRQEWAATWAAASPRPPASGASATRLTTRVNTAAAMGAVLSSPAVGRSGNIFIGSNDAYLYSFFPNGTQRWAVRMDAYVTASPAISPADSTRIVVGDRAGMLHLINDASSGDVTVTSMQVCSRGSAPVPGNSSSGAAASTSFATAPTGFGTGMASSPAIDAHGNIYVGCLDGRLMRLSSGGAVEWTKYTGGGIVSSPALRMEDSFTTYVYVASLDGCVYAFEAATGNPRWPCYNATVPLTSSPALPDYDLAGGESNSVGDTLYLTTTRGSVLALWGGNGTLRWQFTLPTPQLAPGVSAQAPLTPTPAFGRNCSGLFIGGWDGGVWALSPSTGAALWSFATPAVMTASPALGYSTTTCGRDYSRLGFLPYASAGDAAGLPPGTDPTCTCYLYTAGEDGWVRAFNASSGTQVWVFKGALGPIRSSPAIDSRGRVVFGASNAQGSSGAVYMLGEGEKSVSASASASVQPKSDSATRSASASSQPRTRSVTRSPSVSASDSGSPSSSSSAAPSLNYSASITMQAPTATGGGGGGGAGASTLTASPSHTSTPSRPYGTVPPSRLPSRSPATTATMRTPLPTPSPTSTRWVSPSTHPWPCAGGNAARTNAAPTSGRGSAILSLAPRRMFNPGSDAPGILWTLELGGALRSPPALHSLGWVLVGVDAPGCGGGGGLAVVDGTMGSLLWCTPSLRLSSSSSSSRELQAAAGEVGAGGVRGGAALSLANASDPTGGESMAFIGLNGGVSAVSLVGVHAGGRGSGVVWSFSSPSLCGWDGSSGGTATSYPAFTYTSPVLIGSVVVATCSDTGTGVSVAVGLSAGSGALLWTQALPLGSLLTSTPTFSTLRNTTYVSYALTTTPAAAASTSALRVRAFLPSNGTLQWDVGIGSSGSITPAAPILATPNDLLLVPLQVSTLVALDAGTGAVVWSWTAPPGDLASAGSSALPPDVRLTPWPALNSLSGVIYFPVGAMLYALAGGADQQAWGRSSSSAPPATLWSFATGGALVAPPTVAYDGATVLQPSSDGYLYALHAGSGALAWRLPGAGWTPAAPGANGNLYLGSLTGRLQAVGALATPSPSATPSLSASASASGTLTALDTSTLSSSISLSKTSSASPATSPSQTITVSPTGSISNSRSPAPSAPPSGSVSASGSAAPSASEVVVSSAPVSASNNCPTNTRNFRVNLQAISGAGGGPWASSGGSWGLGACVALGVLASLWWVGLE